MVCKQLKELRKALGLNQSDFGKKLGVSRSVILNIELDKVAPKDVFIDHVCAVFSVNRQWLTDGTGECFASDAKSQRQINELWELYSELRPDFQNLIREQIDRLIQIQNKSEPAGDK